MAAPSIELDGAWGGFLRPQTFQMHQGEDYVLSFTVREADDTAKDLTGSGIRWLLSDKPNSGQKVLKTVGGGITIPVGTDGKFEVTLDDTDTPSLDGTYHHEAEVTDSSGAVQIVAVGRAIILASIFWQLSTSALLGIAGSADDPFGMVIQETFEVF